MAAKTVLIQKEVSEDTASTEFENFLESLHPEAPKDRERARS